MSGNPTRLGLVRCEYCQRQFNPHSAARHIPWCKKQQSDSKKHKLTADKLQALERYKWRISYKPTNKFSAKFDQQRHSGTAAAAATATIASKSRNVVGLSSANSSAAATLSCSSSSSASSSLSNSVGSSTPSNRNNAHSSTRQHKHSSTSSTVASRKSAPEETNQLKLRRSVSSIALARQRGNGSASSKNSRISTTTTTIRALEPGELGPSSSAHTQKRTKSVSDLSVAGMGELVETLAKRMEAIYAQNQLLLECIMSARGGCDEIQTREAPCRQNKVRKSMSDHGGEDASSQDEHEGEEGEVDEFAQCHHCRAECLVEANYCHKCGCKMRPSNPSPPTD